MYFIAFKSLFRRKLRTALASLGVSIGVLLLVVIISVMLGMSGMMDELTMSLVGDIEVIEKGQFDLVSVMDRDLDRTINRIPGVVGTAPRVYAFVKLDGIELPPLSGMIDEDMLESLPEEFQEEMGGARLLGIDPTKEQAINSYPMGIVKGIMFGKGDSGVCVIGSGIVEEADIDVGDTLTVIFDKDNDGVGPSDKHKFRIVGVYETGSMLVDNNVVVSLEDAQDLKGFNANQISRIDVKAEMGMEEEVVRRLKLMVPGVDVMDPDEALGMMNRMTSNINLMTVIMIVFSGAIAFAFILIVMITSVMERTKEIGVLRATGWYKSDVLKLILFESLLLAIMGTVLGTILGIAGLIGMNEIFPGIQVIITPQLISIVIAFGLTVGSVAGIYPAWRAASLSPLEAFREAE